ncbi:hypothetical protein [Streptomyces sp. x-80]|uniref:hypothetical protein n=1 Tax=Streptomyces sp. x-80 TaxID=2789282 RepID=UPI0039809F59
MDDHYRTPLITRAIRKPARSSAVNYCGEITVDYERELAQLDDKGRRPLRIMTTDDPVAGL